MANSTTSTTPIDLLGAVNQLLIANGTVPVTSINTADIHADALKALEVINQCCVQVQQEKWHFNSEDCYPLPISPDGTIPLPSNTLRVRASERFCMYDVVQRGGQLYDRKKHTLVFDVTISPFLVDIAFALEFADIIPAARWYITCLSGRRFVSTELASSSSFQFSDKETQAARAQLEMNDAETRDAPMDFVNPHIMRMTRR